MQNNQESTSVQHEPGPATFPSVSGLPMSYHAMRVVLKIDRTKWIYLDPVQPPKVLLVSGVSIVATDLCLDSR